MLKNDEAASYRLKTLDSSFEGVFLDYLTKTLYQNEQNNKQPPPLKICKETVIASFVVAYMRQNHFLIHQINRRIEAYQSNGMMLYWIMKYTSSKHVKAKKAASSPPTAMKMKNLAGAFQILMYGLLICLICFLIEVFNASSRLKFKSRRNKFFQSQKIKNVKKLTQNSLR